MEIEDYLRHKEKRLEQSSQLIKNYHVFEFNYIPDKPLMREEIKPVADALLRYLKTGIPNNLLIIGSRGSGKTLLVRYLAGRLTQHEGQHLYINCRHHNTTFKILAEFLACKPRGFALEELWTQFQKAYSTPTVMILDEADLLSEKDRHKDIFYLLSRSEQNYMVILLSNNPHFHQHLDVSIRSTLQPEIIHFHNYDAEKIRAILRQRALLGLNKFSEKELAHIAALVARNANSDIRVGIKTLYFSALEKDTGVENNFDRARRDIVTELIQGLSDKNLIILRSAVDIPDGRVKAVYARYRQLSAALREAPFSYPYFYSNLAYLQSIGLVLLPSTKVRRGYTNRIQLLFDKDILTPVWRTRFG